MFNLKYLNAVSFIFANVLKVVNLFVSNSFLVNFTDLQEYKTHLIRYTNQIHTAELKIAIFLT